MRVELAEGGEDRSLDLGDRVAPPVVFADRTSHSAVWPLDLNPEVRSDRLAEVERDSGAGQGDTRRSCGQWIGRLVCALGGGSRRLFGEVESEDRDRFIGRVHRAR